MRILVTGARSSGTELINALVGQDVLPIMAEGETSILASVVPMQVGGAAPALHVSGHDGLPLRLLAEGEGEVRERIRRLHREAQEGGAEDVMECQVSAQLRDSLNVFVPPAAEWRDTRFMDVGGPEGLRRPDAQACVDLAYCLSHQVVICVPFDLTDSQGMPDFFSDIQRRAPYHFVDVPPTEQCPLLFVITQADRADVSPERLAERLRSSLAGVSEAAPSLAARVPIVAVSAEDVLRGPASREWQRLECCLTSIAGCRREVVRAARARRAAHIAGALRDGARPTELGEWPHHAAALWAKRRVKAMKVGAGAVVAVGSAAGVAAALGVCLSGGGGALAVAATAARTATVTAEAGAATAVAQSSWAWLGLGGCRAAAVVAAAKAALSGAPAAGAAGIAVTGCGLAARLSQARPSLCRGALLSPLPSGVLEVAGMVVAGFAAVGARDARSAVLELKFGAKASGINAGEAYLDVHFYPPFMFQDRDVHICALDCPFVLRNAVHGKCLYDSKGRAYCEALTSHASQLWYATPVDGRVIIRNVVTSGCLCPSPHRVPIDKRLAVRSVEDAVEEWEVLPGGQPGTVRLQSVSTKQSLYFDGLFVGCCGEPYRNQDWVVEPRAPWYVGEFVKGRMEGNGQLFWPHGTPLFKGKVVGGSPVEGFLFDERALCLGYFRFDSDGTPIEHGEQLEDVACSSICTMCGERECLSCHGHALDPCGHGVVCEACARSLCDSEGRGECPFCRGHVFGIMRMS